MKYLKKLITKHISIDEKEWKELTTKFKKVTVKKGTIISSAGDIFSDFYFIKNGLARSYFTDLNCKDFTWQIYFRGKSKYGLNNFMDSFENKLETIHKENSFKSLF